MLAGYAGQFSFGHMAFMGLGAYTTALFCHYFFNFVIKVCTGRCYFCILLEDFIVWLMDENVEDDDLVDDAVIVLEGIAYLIEPRT